MSLALYLSRVRSSDLLGGTSRFRSIGLVAIVPSMRIVSAMINELIPSYFGTYGEGRIFRCSL
jgi:hypothetical protein